VTEVATEVEVEIEGDKSRSRGYYRRKNLRIHHYPDNEYLCIRDGMVGRTPSLDPCPVHVRDHENKSLDGGILVVGVGRGRLMVVLYTPSKRKFVWRVVGVDLSIDEW